MFRIITATLLIIGWCPFAKAGEPLRSIPDAADLALVIDKPSEFIDALLKYPAYTSATKMPMIQELLRSPSLKPLYDVIAYYEIDLKQDWRSILKDITANGIAIGINTNTANAALLVLEGDKPAVSEAFLDSLIRVIESEAKKQPESKAKLERKRTGNTEVIHFGPDFHAARTGTRLIFTNNAKGLQLALEKPASEARHAARLKAKTLLGGTSGAWLWYDIAAAKDTQAGRDFYASTKRDVLQNLVVGGTIDAIGRADFLAAGLSVSEGGISLKLRFPAKRSELRPELALHVPPVGTLGSLPLLKPPGTVASLSFHLDSSIFWNQRSKLMNDQQLVDFEKGVSDISKFLPGGSIRKIMEQLGPYHRLVMLDQVSKLYSVSPEQPIPGFAYIGTMREANQTKAVEGFVRAIGIIGTPYAGLTLKEAEINGAKVTIYRFDESKHLADDEPGLRFQFVPCFTIHGEHVIVTSRPEVIEPILKALKHESTTTTSDAPVWQAELQGTGLASLAQQIPEPLVTRLMLTRNLSLKDAQSESRQIETWLKNLGTARLTLDHQQQFYEVNFTWTLSQINK